MIGGDAIVVRIVASYLAGIRAQRLVARDERWNPLPGPATPPRVTEDDDESCVAGCSRRWGAGTQGVRVMSHTRMSHARAGVAGGRGGRGVG